MAKLPAEIVQLARVWNGSIPAEGVWAEPKIDGIRAARIDGQLVTREGAPIHGTGHIARDLARLEARFGCPMMFDGEFVVRESFRETQSHFGRGAAAEDAGTLWLFDALPLSQWRANASEQPLTARKAALTRAFDLLDDPADPLAWEWVEGSRGRKPVEPPLRLVEDRWLFTVSDVDAWAGEIWAAGGEGLVLKDARAPYRRERSASWVKYKKHGWSTRRAG